MLLAMQIDTPANDSDYSSLHVMLQLSAIIFMNAARCLLYILFNGQCKSSTNDAPYSYIPSI